MDGFSRLFAHCCVLLIRNYRLVGCPEVRKAMPLAVGGWNGLPQPLTRVFAPVTQCIGDHLSRLATQGNPHPDLVGFFEHKGPQFIQFQRGRSRILWIGGDQGGA